MCYAISCEVYKNYLHGRRQSQAVAGGEHPQWNVEMEGEDMMTSINVWQMNASHCDGCWSEHVTVSVFVRQYEPHIHLATLCILRFWRLDTGYCWLPFNK